MKWNLEGKTRIWDVIIIGGGPAGLSAALLLGRCLRKVLICDRGTPRNWASNQIHGFIASDPISPRAFIAKARETLGRYHGLAWREAEVTRVGTRADGTFEVGFARGAAQWSRKLLVCTGLFDELPDIGGVASYFGTGVFQCPYCDGWEVRGKRLIAYGRAKRGFEMARALTAWSPQITLCTNGRSGLSANERQACLRHDIAIVETRVAGCCGHDGRLEALRLADGRMVACDAMFFDTPSKPQSKIAQQLGCETSKHGGLRCNRYLESTVPGVFVAGNITRDVQLAIVAAAEGAKAAFGINRALTREAFDAP